MEYSKIAVPKWVHTVLYNMMEDVMMVLEKSKIKFWVDGGSLLGAVRHKGIIPHDDDIDLGIMYDDFNRLIPAVKSLKKIGYGVVITDDEIIKIVSKELYKDRFIVIDIFPWVHIDDRIELYNSTHAEIWPNCYHDEREFFPLTSLAFGSLKVPAPINYEPYLNRMYPNWQKEIVVMSHKNSEFLSTYKI